MIGSINHLAEAIKTDLLEILPCIFHLDFAIKMQNPYQSTGFFFTKRN
jgi:hypothetical protein